MVFAASSAGATALTPAVTLARLQVKITTTSEWTEVLLSPGTVLASRINSIPAGVTVTKLAHGWDVLSPNTTSHVIMLSALYEDPTRSASTTLTIEKGSNGTARVDLMNTSATPFPIGSVVDSKWGEAINRLDIGLVSSKLFGPIAPTYVRPDPRKLILAFYYPWWSLPGYQTWTTLTDRPLQPLSTFDLRSVYWMTAQAHANGIDGFISSWAGAANDGTGFDTALRAAELAGTSLSAIFDTARANSRNSENYPTEPAVAEQWLRELLSRSSSSAFLRSGGVPVVFLFMMNRLSAATWSKIASDLGAQGYPVRLVGDDADQWYRGVEWGYYNYNPNAFTIDGLRSFNHATAADTHLLSTPARLYASTVSPGIDAHLASPGSTIVPRGANGERYAGAWSAALSEQSDWVLITSWNEWSEDTAVEPSVNYGDLALRQTATYASQFHA